MCKIPVVTILGPTASGKTKLSIDLTKHFDAEIVSADSMQIYKNMDIATASPTIEEKQGVVHHMLNFLSPDTDYSVAQYVEKAKEVISDINSRGKLPILVGGTGLYIDSLLENINFIETEVDEALREELYELYEKNGIDYLLDMIKEFDIESYDRLSIEKNPKRVIRCIEVYKTTGITQTMQNVNSKLTPSPYKTVKIGLKCQDRDFLYDRINKRVDIMVNDGLIDEAKEFFTHEYKGTSSMAIGYKELKPYFDNELTLDECLENLKRQTRRYAKRQLTWFNRDKSINWFNIDELDYESIKKTSINLIEDFLNG